MHLLVSLNNTGLQNEKMFPKSVYFGMCICDMMKVRRWAVFIYVI